MEQNKFLKIFSLVAFIAFAAISCWATAESLQFALPNWPAPACWVISIGFFIIASIGTTMIVTSLNQRSEVENRGWKLVGGLVVTLVFWLICSMPTNTHTFFYRNKCNDVVEDLGATVKYLDQLAKAQKITDSIEGEYKEVENKLKGLRRDLYDEIVNEWNRGVATNARAIMSEIEKVSGQEIRELSKSQHPKSESEAKRLADIYDKKVGEIINDKRVEKDRIIKEIKQSSRYVKEAQDRLIELQNAELAIEKGELSLLNAKEMKSLTKKLLEGYTTINHYSQWVSFSSQEDKALYTAEEQKLVTKTELMINVFSVWKEFLQGKYKGLGLWYWVIIAILVDVAAFIFFNITFAKRDDA